MKAIEQYAILVAIEVHRSLLNPGHTYQGTNKLIGGSGMYGCAVCRVVRASDEPILIDEGRCMDAKCILSSASVNPLLRDTCEIFSELTRDLKPGFLDALEELVLKYDTGLFPKEVRP